MKNNNTAKITLLALSVIFLIHIGSTLGKRVKVDFTEESLYSLSDGSKAIVCKLSAPLKLKLYYLSIESNNSYICFSLYKSNRMSICLSVPKNLTKCWTDMVFLYNVASHMI